MYKKLSLDSRLTDETQIERLTNSQSASVYSVIVLVTALIKTKEHSNVSPAEWTSVPTLMHRLRARLTETLMSTGARAIRGSLRLIKLRSSRRMPLLRVQT